MVITLDRDTIPDELYNLLMIEFVKEALKQGYDVNKHSRLEDWVLTCELFSNLH